MKLNPSKLKNMFEGKRLNRFTLLHGDSAVILKTIESASVDLVVTSPPYDGLRDYNGYVFDFETIACELSRVIRPGGVIVWVVGDATVNGSETGTSFKQAIFFKDQCGLNIHDTMIYQKFGTAFPESTRYYQNFEYMFIFSKGPPSVFNPINDRPNKHAGLSRKLSSQRQADGTLFVQDKLIHVKEFGVRVNVWQIHNKVQGIWSEHPATYSFGLARDHILSWSNENALVLDPFLGSGTTGEAAIKNNRRFIGIEVSEKYIKLAEKRMLGFKAKKIKAQQ